MTPSSSLWYRHSNVLAVWTFFTKFHMHRGRQLNAVIFKFLHNWVIPWSKVRFDKLTFPHVVYKVPYLIDPEFRYRVHNNPPLVPVLRDMSSCPAAYFLKSILLLSYHLHLCLLSCISPSHFPTKTLYACIFAPHMCHVSCPYQSPLFGQPNLVRTKNYEATLYGIFSSLVSIPLSYNQIYFSAQYFEHPQPMFFP
jgi:hypothetical protein